MSKPIGDVNAELLAFLAYINQRTRETNAVTVLRGIASGLGQAIAQLSMPFPLKRGIEVICTTVQENALRSDQVLRERGKQPFRVGDADGQVH